MKVWVTIAFDNVSGRVTLGARSATGKQIVNGVAVRIEQVTGTCGPGKAG